jgi:Phage gp6-like head-tail connector protein
MVQLVTIDDVKGWSRIDFEVEDTTLEFMIEGASAAVLMYLKDTALTFVDSSGTVLLDSAGNALTPSMVKIATCLLVEELYRNRGSDGGVASGYQMGFLPPAVTAWLYPLRIPTLA